jgi:hypothetical protein
MAERGELRPRCRLRSRPGEINLPGVACARRATAGMGIGGIHRLLSRLLPLSPAKRDRSAKSKPSSPRLRTCAVSHRIDRPAKRLPGWPSTSRMGFGPPPESGGGADLRSIDELSAGSHFTHTGQAGRSLRALAVGHLDVDRGGLEIGVSQQGLRGAQIRTGGDQVGPVPVAKAVRGAACRAKSPEGHHQHKPTPKMGLVHHRKRNP